MKVLDGLELANQQIRSLADGSAADDAATWGQVQAFMAGLAWKEAVVAASTANVTVASTPSSIDGVSISAGDRVLLKNQSDAKENGIYVAGESGAPMSRAGDAQTSAQLNNATVLVSRGTANADSAWTQTADGPDVGTDDLTFVQFGAGSVNYIAGDGLNLSSTTFSIKLPGSGVVGLVVDGTGIRIDTTVVVRKYSANIGDGSATSIDVTHNLGTRDVTVALFDSVTGEEVITDIEHVDSNKVTLTFAVAPSSNAYRVVIHG